MKKTKPKLLFVSMRFALIVVFLGVCYQEFYVNRLRRFWDAKTELDGISGKLVERLKKRNVLNEFESGERVACQELEAELEKRIPGEIHDGEIDEIIAQAARRSEVTILSVETDESEPAFPDAQSLSGTLASNHDRFRRIPVSIKTQGRSRNIAQFLGLLVAHERMFGLDRAGIERRDADFPNVTGSLDIFAYYREKPEDGR